MANTSVNDREGEMQLTENVSIPFSVLHTDHFGPLKETPKGFKHILLIVDAFTRYTWLYPVKTTSSKETIKHFSELFRIFGSPEIVVSDRGTAFTSQEFSNFMVSLNIKHRQVAVAAPWANGLVERVNKFLKSSLKKVLGESDSWDQALELVQYVINNTNNSSLKSSPSMLLLGYEQRKHTDASLIKALNKIAKIELDAVENREASRKLALNTEEKIKNYNKVYYDKKHRKPTLYAQGDLVLIKDSTIKPGEEKKFKSAYKGPYRIAKVLNNNRYVVQDVPGFNVSSKSYNSILSSDRLKPWIKPVPD
ncbi:unnamed protein product [Lasius platythorax]|uniref:Integrase catalytic domain-containing protein n=1 Tax=Lasius platythorax TaxID=488582 RepID=A0AAV2MY69_9HYME